MSETIIQEPPERIWITSGYWWSPTPCSSGIEYARATEIAAKDQEIARLQIFGRPAEQALEILGQIRDLTASSRSYVPQSNAAEMMLRLEEVGFGKLEGRRGNTLWAMVMDAADEIESLRADQSAEIAKAEQKECNCDHAK